MIRLHAKAIGILSLTALLSASTPVDVAFASISHQGAAKSGTRGAAPLTSAATTVGNGATFGSAGSAATARSVHTVTLLASGKVLVAGGNDSRNSTLASAELYDPPANSWTTTASLATARSAHTATLLPNGKVLVAGGANGSGAVATAELYDPAGNGGMGSWTTTGSLATARYFHTATLLANGKVLVAGGANSSGALASAELYDPVAGSWTTTGSLSIARRLHTATLLANGKVLVAGGRDSGSIPIASAELYDPAGDGGVGSWMTTGSLVTARQLHTAILLPNGKVLVAGGVDNSGTALASAELYDPAAGMWTTTGRLGIKRQFHTATLLPNGKVLVAGGIGNGATALAGAELYDPAGNGGVGSWVPTVSLATGRYQHTATLLPNGKVLVAGGVGSSGAVASAELYDPAGNGGMGSWTTTGSLGTARYFHTATLLANGKVLVAGGFNNTSGAVATAELYDPAGNGGMGSWAPTISLATARYNHTATLLPNGKVLVAGGLNSSGALASAELFDPAGNGGLGSWTTTGSLVFARYFHTATLLPNGKVLVAGGQGISGTLASAELYDPAGIGGMGGPWTPTGSLATARTQHTATLLANGKVLVAGGGSDSSIGGGILASAELYDPAGNGGVGSWTTTGSLATGRYNHTATLLSNGKVLVAGGVGNSGDLASAELYDPAAGLWTATGSLSIALEGHTATLLSNGKVLLAGGADSSGTPLTSAELYDPTENGGAGSWTPTGSLETGRIFHTAMLLVNGKVLLAGGQSGTFVLTSAELYDPEAAFWTPTGSLATARSQHTATLLPNGKVLVAGGADNSGTPLASAELYDPTGNGGLGSWTPTGSLSIARYQHRATLLANGKVLVAGGYNGGGLASAELYDPAGNGGVGSWTSTGTLSTARYFHTATLLVNGKVLLAGGQNGSVVLTSAELYDPTGNGGLGSWTTTASLGTACYQHTATSLPNGKVLVAGGADNSGAVATAELYDPAAGSWTTTGGLVTARSQYTATLLPNGKVLVAGGLGSGTSGVLASAELYDPVAGSWTTTGGLATARDQHTATLLPYGKVLVAGGFNNNNGTVASAELYDPVSNDGLGSWTTTGNPASPNHSPRYQHTASLLANGKVLVAGGLASSINTIASAELYEMALGFNSAWQPQLTSATSPLSLGTSLVATGSRFEGVSGASSGNVQDSATNYPLAQLLSLGNEQTVFLLSDPATNWSNTSFTSRAVTGFPPGYTLVTVFTNAIPSNSRIIQIVAPPPVQLVSVVSRKVHGSAGPFDIDLPQSGTRGVECRSGGPTSDYTMVFNFLNPVTNCGAASTGLVSSGPSPNQCTVNLTEVPNAQYLTVTLTGAVDSSGATGNVSGTMGVLLGDVNASGVVTSGDTNLCKAQALQPVTNANFRNDINASGAITTGDVNIIKQNALHQLPSPP